MTGECACNKQEAKRELAGWLEEGRSSLFFPPFASGCCMKKVGFVFVMTVLLLLP